MRSIFLMKASLVIASAYALAAVVFAFGASAQAATALQCEHSFLGQSASEQKVGRQALKVTGASRVLKSRLAKVKSEIFDAQRSPEQQAELISSPAFMQEFWEVETVLRQIVSGPAENLPMYRRRPAEIHAVIDEFDEAFNRSLVDLRSDFKIDAQVFKDRIEAIKILFFAAYPNDLTSAKLGDVLDLSLPNETKVHYIRQFLRSNDFHIPVTAKSTENSLREARARGIIDDAQLKEFQTLLSARLLPPRMEQ